MNWSAVRPQPPPCVVASGVTSVIRPSPQDRRGEAVMTYRSGVRVLFLVDGDQREPSARLRATALGPALARLGVKTCVLDAPGRSGMAGRLRLLAALHAADVVVLGRIARHACHSPSSGCSPARSFGTSTTRFTHSPDAQPTLAAFCALPTP